MAKIIGPDWYLQEWVRSVGKKQADFGKALELEKNSTFRLWHSRQPYRRDIVNAVAAWLGIKPYELLMPPEEAYAIRRIRADALRIASETKEAEIRERRPTRVADAR